jgi:hypothetical protein
MDIVNKEKKTMTNQQIQNLLTQAAQTAGVEGIWLLRGAEQVTLLAYQVDDKMLSLELADPSELVILIRFPAGDGGEPGIEHF